MQMNSQGKSLDPAIPLNTTDRISIAQCLNLANEHLVTTGEPITKGDLITLTKFYFDVKTTLEKEYLENNKTFK